MSESAAHYGEGPANGNFCWTEIAVTDAAKCKDFYSTVFDWKFIDNESVTPGFSYHEFTAGDPFPAGGLYELSQEMCGEGEMPPPHFLSYIAVENVDATAQLATELGGTVIKEPTDIPNTGRFAIVQDPSGAMFSIFKMN